MPKKRRCGQITKKGTRCKLWRMRTKKGFVARCHIHEKMLMEQGVLAGITTKERYYKKLEEILEKH